MLSLCHLLASENNLQNRRLKLDYEEITPCLKEVTLIWEKLLSAPGRSKTKVDVEKIHSAVGQGKHSLWFWVTEMHTNCFMKGRGWPLLTTPCNQILTSRVPQLLLEDVTMFNVFVVMGMQITAPYSSAGFTELGVLLWRIFIHTGEFCSASV